MRRGAVLFGSFSAAVFAAVYLFPAGLWPWLGAAALIPAGVCLWRGRRRGVLIALGASAALLWCAAYRMVMVAPGEALDDHRTQVSLLAAEYAARDEYGFSLPCYILDQGRVPIRGVLYGGEALEAVKPGDSLTVTADCSCRTDLDRGEVSNAAGKGILVTLRARSSLQIDPADRPPWWSLPRIWGRELARQVEAAFPEDVSGLVTAMVAGERSVISDSDYTALKRAGVAHLMAVSGMHVCFLISLLSLFTGAEPRRRAAVCLPVTVVFALAVGGSASVLRACIIWGFALLAPVVGRENDLWSALAAALFFLLLGNPLSAANAGLQLSFAAVAGIGLVTPRLSEGMSGWTLPPPEEGSAWKWLSVRAANWLLRLVRNALASTLGALVFTVPLSAYYFGTLSLAAPLTNVLVLPVAAVVFALGLVTGLVGFASPAAAAVLGRVLAWPARYVMAVARGVGAFPYSAVTLNGVYYPAFLLFAYGLVLIAVLWRGQRRRWWVFAGCGGVMLCAAVLLTRLTFHRGDLTVTALNVGQGQSILLTSAGETALVDCGGSAWTDPGDLAADYLADRGESRVDLLILTHYHDDHMNGVATLFDRLDIGRLILPEMEEDTDRQLWLAELAATEGAEVTWVQEDQTFALGGATLQIFAPLGSGDANEAGLSVLASAGDFDALITGDMGSTVERRLVKYHELPRCEVLVAGHHGSAGSNGETLLNAIRPQIVLVSVGSNSYGHPAQETLDRMANLGADVYRTDLRGNLTVTATVSREGG